MMPSYEHWTKLGIKFDCLYTGFIGTMETVEATLKIAKDLKEKGAIIAIDPACAEHGKLYPIFDEAYKAKIFELCKINPIFAYIYVAVCLCLVIILDI
jgi:pyridoxine kinase